MIYDITFDKFSDQLSDYHVQWITAIIQQALNIARNTNYLTVLMHVIQVQCLGARCLLRAGTAAHLNAGNERVNPALDLLGHDTFGGVQLGEDWGREECTERLVHVHGSGSALLKYTQHTTNSLLTCFNGCHKCIYFHSRLKQQKR